MGFHLSALTNTISFSLLATGKESLLHICYAMDAEVETPLPPFSPVCFGHRTLRQLCPRLRGGWEPARSRDIGEDLLHF